MKTEDRTRHLLTAFGWQGGTIHQLAEETGCSVQDLLYGDYDATYARARINDDFYSGWSAVRTCERAFNLEHNFPNNKGNLAFWFGVMRGAELTEQLVESA